MIEFNVLTAKDKQEEDEKKNENDDENAQHEY